MDVSITARHCSLPDGVREHAESRFSRLVRYEPRLSGADLILEEDHGIHRVEARLVVAGVTSVAHGTGNTFRMAIDRAAERVGRQLKRRRERLRDHQSIKLSEKLSPLSEAS